MAAPHIRRGGLSNPVGVACIAPGKILVVEAGRSRIVCCHGSCYDQREVLAGSTAAGGGDGGGAAGPSSYAAGAGSVSASIDYGGGGGSGTPRDAACADQARLFQPRFVVSAAGGAAVYFTDGKTLRRFVPSTGEVRTIAGVPARLPRNGSPLPGAAAMTAPAAAAAAAAEAAANMLPELPVDPGARFEAPSGLALDEDANRLYVTDSSSHAIKFVDLATGEVAVLVRGGYGLRYPCGLALARGGETLFVTDEGGVKRVDVTTGLVACVAGFSTGFEDGPGLEAKFNGPRGLCLDDKGRLFVADAGNACVRMIDAAGAVSTVVPPGIVKQPSCVDITHRGELAVTDQFQGMLHVFDLELERPDAIRVPPSRFAARMAALLESGDGADVVFEVAGERVPAHRLLLAAQSDYFRRLLDPAAFAEGRAEVVPVPDTTAAAFRALLRYLYTDELRFGDDVVLDVMLLGQRLCLPRVQAHCKLHVRHGIAPGNVVRWLVWLDEHGHAGYGELRAAAMGYLACNFKHVRRDQGQLAMLMEKRPDLVMSLLQHV